MKFDPKKPKQTLNKAYLKEKLSRLAIESFKQNFNTFLNNTSLNRNDEEHLKSQVIYFLRDTWYKESHQINPIGKNDLVIHTGRNTSDPVAVIVEVKSITNKVEMISLVKKPNAKALHELILYYLRERLEVGNNEVKFLIATNIFEWFIFDANEFDAKIFRNPAIKRLYELKKTDNKDNPWFYDELKKLLQHQDDLKLEVTHFNIQDFEQAVIECDPTLDKSLIAIYKILSPEHLLKLPFANDSNTLQPRFYGELLHIIGLVEVREGNKKFIRRKLDHERNNGSLLESAILALESHDRLSQLRMPSQYGDNHQERFFNVALELVITWINRVLFLKLLEAQLASYHNGDPSYRFLNKEKIKDFDDLDKLFFSVLAKRNTERRKEIQDVFGKVPYLNSSLFEPTDLEHQTLFINGLEDRVLLPMVKSTVLKDARGKSTKASMHTIDYLLSFLDAYDFSSDGAEEIQEDNKTLINASVLGLIFEKINGYKDGSFFTPGIITMYMCRETIRNTVVQKFNFVKDWNLQGYDELYDRISNIKEANEIINSLKICDPAVGSGHYLVSALNELLAIKSDLRILLDREGHRLKEYRIEVVNDELVVTDEEGQLFDYKPGRQGSDSQRVQETLFHEKQIIIENCLFGVDINANSVKICRLRLWIELLKNAYYKSGGELETLPNIDINIKVGNSLISRFPLDADLKVALKKSRFGIEAYKIAVQTYRNARDKEEKRDMERLISSIKTDFRFEIGKNDPKVIKMNRLAGELYNVTNQRQLFGESKMETKLRKEKTNKLEKEIKAIGADVDEIKSNKIYENAFEWRFEFPEVLDDEGDFVGFDIVIGNPPYIPSKAINVSELNYYLNSYSSVQYQINTYGLFCEKGIQLLKNFGKQCFIIPNYWLATDADVKLRQFLFQEHKTHEIINIYSVFESAVVDTLIITTEKTGAPPETRISIKSIKRSLTTITQRLDSFHNEDWGFKSHVDAKDSSGDGKISFEDKIILNGTKVIGELFDLKFGIKLYQVGKGKPTQSERESKDKAYESSIKIDDSYYKLLRARNVQRYHIRNEEYYVKYGPHLAEPRNLSLFTGERILIQRIVSKGYLDASICNSQMVCNTDVITLKPLKPDINIEFYLGIICSKLCAKVLKSQNINLDRVAYPKINTKTLSSFPVPEYNDDYQSIVIIVQNLLVLGNNSSSSSEIDSLQSRLDQMVYKLYNLSDLDIEMIEKQS